MATNPGSTPFLSVEPQLADYWRGIILFGRNVASYKFALAKALLELQPQSGQLVKMSDLAPVYTRHIVQHLKIADKQGTSGSSKFLDACRKFNAGGITENELVEQSVRYGFNNVIDAFHVVGQAEVPKRFYIDERKQHNGIRITDELHTLLAGNSSSDLGLEVEARWRLVETAWELGVSRNLIAVSYDAETEIFFSVDGTRRRKAITSSRAALNGYQKGKCFCDIHISPAETIPDVDHFFPHTLKQKEFGANLDGVWNLVLSCQSCNRGAGGKFDRVPSLRLLERLHQRNEYLISSHHPLRETLMQQTGATPAERIVFLNAVHSRAWSALIHLWEPDSESKPPYRE